MSFVLIFVQLIFVTQSFHYLSCVCLSISVLILDASQNAYLTHLVNEHYILLNKQYTYVLRGISNTWLDNYIIISQLYGLSDQ